MDPNETLEQIRELARQVLAKAAMPHEAWQLAGAFQDLDSWLVAGGFRPTGWNWPPIKRQSL